MTLLAKALFDNLADAPDELSFRKGDIVTVIEQDVDGLVGWWLCLLHGRQGIAPGNRLRIITSTNESKERAFNQASVAKEAHRSLDVVDGATHRHPVHAGSEYDVLPAPVKASHGELFESPSPKSLKDVFTSKVKSPLLTNSASPGGHPFVSSDYDELPKRGPNTSFPQMSPGELYDIPTTTKTSPSDSIYDVVPNRRSIQSTMSPPPNTPPPKFQNVLSAFTAIPDDGVANTTDADAPTTEPSSASLYDTPKSAGNTDLYDYPSSMFSPVKENDSKSHLTPDAHELYDVPTSNGGKAKPAMSSEDIYNVPRSGTAFRKNFNFSLLREDSRSKQGNARTDFRMNASEELYDVPTKANYGKDETTPAEIYDTPPSHYQSSAGNKSTLNEIYDTPPSIQKQFVASEIYDTPVSSFSGAEIYDTPPNRDELAAKFMRTNTEKNTQQNVSEIYDIPPQQTTKGIDKSREQPEQYDIYDRPVNSVNRQKNLPASHDIYDTPSSTDIYDTPSSSEIYDQLPNRAPAQGALYSQQLERNNYANESQDLYDVPSKHDVNKVMNDIARFKTTNQSFTKAYTKHPRSSYKGSVSNCDDDDYVDYQDIYGKEPPVEMVKEMEKAPETSTRGTPSKPLRKKSSLDQINMSAVKELKLSQMQAYERLNKLHLAVDTSISALVSNSDGDWLDPSVLAQKIYAIKDMSNKVKLALRLLTEFALGAVVNAKLLSLEMEANLIKSDVEPLLESYYRIKVCLLHLDSCNWEVPRTRDSSTDKFFATVNAIMILGGRVPEACRKLTSTLHFNVKRLFVDQESSESGGKGLTERMADLKMKSNLSKSLETVNSEKGKLKPLAETVDDKKVREILELDARPASKWDEHEMSSSERANGADLSPMEMKQEFQSRRQKGYNSTLPRRPPVPPKPNLPTNRRSMAAFLSDEEGIMASPVVAKADTLVTDFITEDGRKKYASDPSRSPVEAEPTRKPEWGGSCPQLDDPTSYSTPQHMLRATSSGTAASSTSTTSMNNSGEELDANANLNKIASDSNLFAQTMIPSRVTESVGPSHVRSASLPWDDNKIPFSSYEKQQNSSSLKGGNIKRLSKLDHRDSEAIVFFLQRVESQVLILRDAVRNLTESVSNSDAPQLFVPHSKFVILTAHKVVHAGEELCAKLLNGNVQTNIKRATGRLADSIRGVVAGTKQAALDYPNQNSLMEMMTTVLSVGESVREVHKEAKKALEL